MHKTSRASLLFLSIRLETRPRVNLGIKVLCLRYSAPLLNKYRRTFSGELQCREICSAKTVQYIPYQPYQMPSAPPVFSGASVCCALASNNGCSIVGAVAAAVHSPVERPPHWPKRLTNPGTAQMDCYSPCSYCEKACGRVAALS